MPYRRGIGAGIAAAGMTAAGALSALQARPAGDVAQAIRSIRARVESVDACTRKGCTKATRDLPGESAEGGTVVGYFQRGALCKIEATFYGETGKVVEEYYLTQRSPCFTLTTLQKYDQPLGSHQRNTPPGTVAHTIRERFYFAQGHLIRWLGDGNRSIPLTSPAARARERTLLADAARFTALFPPPRR